MLIKYFYDDQLAQASYLIGCPATQQAVVIDAARNITPYLETAEKHGFKITYVTETHIHADFVSGTRELAHLTNAQILLSAYGGDDWSYTYPDANIRLLQEGDQFLVGAAKFEVLHTPGHTPEHICFMVTDTDASEPMGIFTGDFIFVGDIGRPDLLDIAVGLQGTREIGARQQYQNILRFRDMPDYLHIWPGHGAGSACGKALGAIPSTTLGYEKRFNPAFQQPDEETFVAWLLDSQPEVPHYFRQMKLVNREGPELLLHLPQAQHIHDTPGRDIVPDDAFFIDTRPADAFARKHIPDTINIPISSDSFATYVGWYVDYTKPVFFLAYPNDVMRVVDALLSIGVDNVPGYFTNDVIDSYHTRAVIKQKSPQEIYKAGIPILDVRDRSEYNSEHIVGVKHIHMGSILNNLDLIPKNQPLAIQCGGGLRSQVVASWLQKHGYQFVVNMAGGIDAWKAAGLPVE